MKTLCHHVLLIVLAVAPLGCERATRPPAPTHVEVDKLLVLMQRRLELMHEVARWKWNAKKPIADPEREQQLLDRLVEQGAERRLDPAFTRDFFRAQIEAAKLVQQADFAAWTAREQAPFTDVPDLATELRPRIDKLSSELLDALVSVPAARNDRQFQQLLADRANLLLVGQPAEARSMILAPLTAVKDHR